MTIDENADDALIIDPCRINTRAQFDQFLDRVLLAAEGLWPSEAVAPSVNIVVAPGESGEVVAEQGGSALSAEAQKILGATAVMPARASSPPPQPSPAARERGGAPDGEVADLKGAARRARMLALKEQGRTLREIAATFGTSEGAVSVAISEARRERAAK